MSRPLSLSGSTDAPEILHIEEGRTELSLFRAAPQRRRRAGSLRWTGVGRGGVIELPAEGMTGIRVSAAWAGESPNYRLTLCQALPKGDKMDLIVQKATELGVARIIPMMTARTVSRPQEPRDR